MSELLYYIWHSIFVQGLYEIRASILARRGKIESIKFKEAARKQL